MAMGRATIILLIVAAIIFCYGVPSYANTSDTPVTGTTTDSATTSTTTSTDTAAPTVVKDPCVNPSMLAKPACRLLELAKNESLISDDGRTRLLAHLVTILAEDTPSTTFFWSIINGVRSQFTLMNVLYGVGAIIVVISGAVFITLAWDTFSGLAIVFIAGAYAIAFAIGGYQLYFSSGYTVAGGILFTLAECMMPLCVHGLIRFCRRDTLARRYQNWIIMELAVIVVATIISSQVPFIFTTIPLAIAFVGFGEHLPQALGLQEASRPSFRTVFGLLSVGVIMIIDYIHNISTTASWYSNMTFLPMVVSSGMFWCGLTLRPPSSAYKRFVYLLVNFGIVLLGALPIQRLPTNLWVLCIYGAIGMIAYHFTLFEWQHRDENRRLMPAVRIVDALAFILATRLQSTSIALLAVACLLLLSLTRVIFGSEYMTRVRSDAFTYGMGITSEMIQLPFLLVDLYLFTCLDTPMFKVTWEVGLLSINVAGAFALALMSQAASFAYHHGVAAAFAMSSDVPRPIAGRILTYIRVRWSLFAVLVRMLPRVLPLVFSISDKLATHVSGLLVPVLALSYLLSNFAMHSNYMWGQSASYRDQKPYHFLHSFAWDLLVLSVSRELSSSLLYLISLGSLIYCNIALFPESKFWQQVYVLINILLVAASLFLDMSIPMLIGLVFFFRYVVHLAMRVFRNSFLFPLILSVMGLFIIYLGLMYQKNHDAIQAMLSANAIRPELATAVIGVFTAIISLIYTVVPNQRLEDFRSSKPVNLSGDPLLVLESFAVDWASATDGIRFRIKAKPKERHSLRAIAYAEAHISGSVIWDQLGYIFGSTQVSLIKWSFHPLPLLPGYVDAAAMTSVSAAGEVQFAIELGSGRHNTPKIGVKTMMSTFDQLIQRSDAPFQLVITGRVGNDRDQRVILRVQLKPSVLRQADGTNILEAMQRRRRDALAAAAAAATAVNADDE